MISNSTPISVSDLVLANLNSEISLNPETQTVNQDSARNRLDLSRNSHEEKEHSNIPSVIRRVDLTLTDLLCLNQTSYPRSKAKEVEKLALQSLGQSAPYSLRQAVSVEIDQLNDQIQRRDLDFEEFTSNKPESSQSQTTKNSELTLSHLLQKSFETEMLIERVDRMSQAHAAAVVGRVVTYPVVLAIELSVKGIQSFAEKYPAVNKGCQKLKEVYASFVSSIPDSWKNEMARLLVKREEIIEKEARFFQQHMGIPKEMSYQYHDDSAENLLSLLTTGGVGLISRGVKHIKFKSRQRLSKSLEKVSSIPENIAVKPQVVESFSHPLLKKCDDVMIENLKTLRGRISLKENVLLLEVDMLEANYSSSSKKRLNLFHMIDGLKKLALDNKATELQVEAYFLNKKLLKTLANRYEIIGKRNIYQHVLNIPLQERSIARSSAFISSRSNIFIQTRKAIEQIYEKLPHQSQDLTPLSHHLLLLPSELYEKLPDFTHLGISEKEIWNSLLKDCVKESSSNIKVEYIKNGIFKQVVKIEKDLQSFIIKTSDYHYGKELVAEVLGLDFINSLQLKHMKTSPVLVFGTYETESSNYFVIKRYTPGKTFEEFLSSISQHSKRMEVRIAELNEFIKASRQAGKALGELQAKGLQAETRPFSEIVECFSSQFHENLRDANHYLDQMRFTNIKVHEDEIKNLFQAFKTAPGEISYGFVDHSPSNFIWSKEHASFGYTGTEFIPQSFSLDKKPLSLVQQEYYNFLSIYEREGIEKGLTIQEIQQLKEAFTQGYFLEYTGPWVATTDRFFDIYYSVKSIQTLASAYCLGEINLNLRHLLYLINQLNYKLSTG